MRLPNAENARVLAVKLTGYLLSTAHPRGRGKALFFHLFGFRHDTPEVLEQALLRHALDNEVVRTIDAPHGTKYEIEGKLLAPDGRTPMVKSVWIIDKGSVVPRFVTALPGLRPRK
jgi:hypothetical protein